MSRQLKKCALIGSRGMVGQVLMERMEEEGDFDLFEPHFFSTSQITSLAKNIKGKNYYFYDARDLNLLSTFEIILSCQGGEYTEETFFKLRALGWKGYWIDAASTLRLKEDALIVLDPVNKNMITQYLKQGGLNLIGANCTVSLMLMAIKGLLAADLVEWVSSMTYQAASGGGAAHMKELLKQISFLGHSLDKSLKDQNISSLDLEKKSLQIMKQNDFPKAHFAHPLALNLLPWIDSEKENGQSKEEWKGGVEANKILGLKNNSLAVDGTCVRVGALRCHSQALTIKLKKEVPLIEIENLIKNGHQWIKFVENKKEQSLKSLTPEAVSGKLDIAVGRARFMNLGPTYLNLFTVGDQLLWGAAEPLRRALRFVIDAL